MTAPSFDNDVNIKPTYGQQKRSAPLTRTVRFADGYEHRLIFGLPQNQNPKIFNFTFNVSETDSDIIETFLDARANDSASSTFTPPGESSSSQLFANNGVSRYLITIERLFKLPLDKYLNQQPNVSISSSI